MENQAAETRQNDKKQVVFSGIQPSGNITLGNYIGALKNFTLFDDAETRLYCIVDLHSLTVRQDPALLRKRAGGSLRVDIAAGNDFPEDLSPYNLIVHCGACVANARLVRSRIRKALLAGVPITNYGIALAALNGILGRISIP